MPVIDQTVVIARPAAEVLDFLVRRESLSFWEALIEKAQANVVKANLATLVRLLEPQAA